MRELLRARAACGLLLVCWVFSRFGSLRVRLFVQLRACACCVRVLLCACAAMCVCCCGRVLCLGRGLPLAVAAGCCVCRARACRACVRA